MLQSILFLLNFFSSFLISFLFIKVLIKVSIEKKIFDLPSVERKIHFIPIPNIGGLALFFTVLFCMLIFAENFHAKKSINFLYSGIVILFLIGLKDDLVGLSSVIRFFGQLLSGCIIVLSVILELKIFLYLIFQHLVIHLVFLLVCFFS
jgi:UDP-GlcNAc:undecaprenyl-phosphate GlcNAc-1-phosphate transferase